MSLAPYWAASIVLAAIGTTALTWAITSTRTLRKETAK
jgi:nitrogen fixation-related uncharacterized protein